MKLSIGLVPPEASAGVQTAVPSPRPHSWGGSAALSPGMSEAYSLLRRTPGRGGSVSRSVVPDSATPWTTAHQAPWSVGFSRQGYWSGSRWWRPLNPLLKDRVCKSHHPLCCRCGRQRVSWGPPTAGPHGLSLGVMETFCGDAVMVARQRERLWRCVAWGRWDVSPPLEVKTSLRGWVCR